MRTVFSVFVLFVIAASASAAVTPGIERLFTEWPELVQDKRVAIVANHTAVNAEGEHLVDLIARVGEVACVFAPEHGFRGDVEAGGKVEDETKDDFPIYSLYGRNRTPTPDMLEGVDLIVYDIQDVGVKFYTYISSLFMVMTAADRDGIPVVVLDRPNPIDAVRVAGPATHPAYSSFVGVIPLTIRYGMTVGEIARLFNGEDYAGFGLDCELIVIENEGYTRDMPFDETGLTWIPPSPNIPTVETAQAYPGMCLFEGFNISEGRGTPAPFLTIGAPYINGEEWIDALPDEALAGFEVFATTFVPKRIPGKSENPKYEDERCGGVRLKIVDETKANPIELAVAMLCAVYELYPDDVESRSFINLLWGNEDLRAMLEGGASYDEILETANDDIVRFQEVRARHLLY